jgi:hypothetical protein
MELGQECLWGGSQQLGIHGGNIFLLPIAEGCFLIFLGNVAEGFGYFLLGFNNLAVVTAGSLRNTVGGE